MVPKVIVKFRFETDHSSTELWAGQINLPVYMPVPRLGEILELGDDLSEFSITEVFHRYDRDEGPAVILTASTRLEGFKTADIIAMLREGGLWRDPDWGTSGIASTTKDGS